MSSPNTRPISKLLLALFVLSALGCGVKGDPLPPEKPAVLGRGRPTYQRASEEIVIEKKKPKKPEDKDREDE